MIFEVVGIIVEDKVSSVIEEERRRRRLRPKQHRCNICRKATDWIKEKNVSHYYKCPECNKIWYLPKLKLIIK